MKLGQALRFKFCRKTVNRPRFTLGITLGHTVSLQLYYWYILAFRFYLYHEAIMKQKTIITLTITVLFSSWIMVTRADEINQKSYVQSVIDVLRINADAISYLSTHKIKYSDNLVRHAVAIQTTFGLLGPMDWHAADSATLMNKNTSNSDMDEEHFEKLERRSRTAMKTLVIAAQDAMIEDNREGIKQALENVKNSCNACHSYLPETVAPDVWGTLKRK